MNSDDISKLPPGSTVILSTTSPEKKEEYAALFRRYDINFFTVEDFGLSPPKTPEMQSDYEGNLLEKGYAVSRLLHDNREAIKARLKAAGLDPEKPIVGMVEDSGIEFEPKDKHFRRNLNTMLGKAILGPVLPDVPLAARPEFEDALGNLSKNRRKAREQAIRDSKEWILFPPGENKAALPGPNYKNILENERGGFPEFMDQLLHLNGGQTLHFRNRCAALLVPPSNHPSSVIDVRNIIEGESGGRMVTEEEFRAMVEQRLNPRETDTYNDFATGSLFTSDVLIPEGQTGEIHYSRRTLIEKHGLLQTKNGKICEDYRLMAADKLAEFHQFPLRTTERAITNYKPRVVILHPPGGERTRAYDALCNKLRAEGIDPLTMPSREELLADPNLTLMDRADVAIVLPNDDPKDLQNLRLLLAATVDRQVMPGNKETSLYVYSPNDVFEPSLSIIRDLTLTGRKNGPSEIRKVVASDNLETLFDSLPGWLQEEARRMENKLRHINPIPTHSEEVPELVSVPEDTFTVGVFGGVANEYLGYKEPANRLGRFIYNQGWTLVTGAGQKEGPMGAVHSGFVERYLETDAQKKQKLTKGLDNTLDKLALDLSLKQIAATAFKQSIKKKLNAKYLDAEDLANEAPGLLEQLLEPLKESRRCWGFSMPPLLISEGSGKPPPGMFYQDAGNMQRRMEQMMKSTTHVFMTGGQGTIQELVESLMLNAQALELGEDIKDIHLFTQPTHNPEGYHPGERKRTYDVTLEVIDAYLQDKGLTREDVGLKISHSIGELKDNLKQTKKRWQQRVSGRPSHESIIQL